MALPDDNEKLLIEKFRERTKDVLTNEHQSSDLFLIRWIRARDHDLKKALEMLINSMEWRKLHSVDKILQELPDDYFVKGFPYYLNGVDRKGQPVASWNMVKIVQDGRMEEFTKYSNRLFERLMHTIQICNSKRNSSVAPITQFTLILNYDNFSMTQMMNLKVVQSILHFAMTYEAHYPEILDKAVLINTNFVFQALFVLMRPLLASRTLTKMSIFGTNRLEWEPVIRELVDDSQLARQFGG